MQKSSNSNSLHQVSYTIPPAPFTKQHPLMTIAGSVPCVGIHSGTDTSNARVRKVENRERRWHAPASVTVTCSSPGALTIAHLHVPIVHCYIHVCVSVLFNVHMFQASRFVIRCLNEYLLLSRIVWLKRLGGT